MGRTQQTPRSKPRVFDSRQSKSKSKTKGAEAESCGKINSTSKPSMGELDYHDEIEARPKPDMPEPESHDENESESRDGRPTCTLYSRGGMYNEDVPLGLNIISILVAAQYY